VSLIATRATKWMAGTKDCETEVEILDEGSGEFLLVSQPLDSLTGIRINGDEWPAIRDAIDNAFAEIKRHEEAEKVGEN